MKRVKLLLLGFCVAGAWHVNFTAYAQSLKDVVEIEFKTFTRGYTKEVRITPRQLQIQVQSYQATGDKSGSAELMKEDWMALCSTLNGLDLNVVPELESPSMRRATDAARTSVIELKLEGGKILAHEFDNENPHEKLKPLLDQIMKVIEKRSAAIKP